MKLYKPRTPKVAFSVIAVFVTAVTLCLFVTLPAELEMAIPSAVVAVAQHLSP